MKFLWDNILNRNPIASGNNFKLDFVSVKFGKKHSHDSFCIFIYFLKRIELEPRKYNYYKQLKFGKLANVSTRVRAWAV